MRHQMPMVFIRSWQNRPGGIQRTMRLCLTLSGCDGPSSQSWSRNCIPLLAVDKGAPLQNPVQHEPQTRPRVDHISIGRKATILPLLGLYISERMGKIYNPGISWIWNALRPSEPLLSVISSFTDTNGCIHGRCADEILSTLYGLLSGCC